MLSTMKKNRPSGLLKLKISTVAPAPAAAPPSPTAAATTPSGANAAARPQVGGSTLSGLRGKGEPLREASQEPGPILVLPGLYLGNEDHARDEQQLDRLNITSILNVASEVVPTTTTPPALTSSSSSRRYLHLPWIHNQPDIAQSFDQAFTFIDCGRNRRVGEAVLVHCQLGRSRSASLLIGYIMRTLGYSSHRAYALLKAKSPLISPNINLVAQLAHYEKLLVVDSPTPKLLATTTTIADPLSAAAPLATLGGGHLSGASTTFTASPGLATNPHTASPGLLASAHSTTPTPPKRSLPGTPTAPCFTLNAPPPTRRPRLHRKTNSTSTLLSMG